MIRTIGYGACALGVVLAALGFAGIGSGQSRAAPPTAARVAFFTQNLRFVRAPHFELASSENGDVAVRFAFGPRHVERAALLFDERVLACTQRSADGGAPRALHLFTLPVRPARRAIAFFADGDGRGAAEAIECRYPREVTSLVALERNLPLAALIARTRLEYAAHPNLGTRQERLYPLHDKPLVRVTRGEP